IARRRLTSRLVTSNELPQHDSGCAIENAGELELGEQAIEPVRAFADVLQKENGTLWRCEGVRRSERCSQLRGSSPRKPTPRLPTVENLHAAHVELADRFRRGQRANERVAIVPGGASRQTPLEHWAMKLHNPARRVQVRQQRREIAVTDKRLGIAAKTVAI